MGEGEEDVNPPPWWSDPWWRWFLTIAFASIVVGLIFFLANWRLAVLSRRRTERAQRISEVVDDYVRYATMHPLVYTGTHAVILAGVKRLRDNEEIGQALTRIEARTGQRLLKNVDPRKLKAFCDEVTVDDSNVVGEKAALAKHSTKL